MDTAQGRTPEEILQAVKPVIKGAYAIRTLRSGDVDVLVPNQQDRDTAVNQAETGLLKSSGRTTRLKWPACR